MEKPAGNAEEVKQRLAEFGPPALQFHEKRLTSEEVEIIADRIKADPELSDDERKVLLEELRKRYETKIPTFSHMGE